MTIPWGLLLILYWILISFLSVIVTVSDKRRAKKHLTIRTAAFNIN